MIRPVVYEHLSALLSSAARYSALLIERVVVGLWRLCFILAKNVSQFSTLTVIYAQLSTNMSNSLL